jgi:hypothetical protein
LLEDTSRNGYARRGASIGCLTAVIFWWIPIPVAAIVWLFDLKGPFVDYMFAAIPVFLALPLVGCVIGLLVRRRNQREPPGGSASEHWPDVLDEGRLLKPK